MASMTADTRLMDNYVAGAPVADVKDFFTLCDESHEPMMLYLDKTKGQLVLVHRNAINNTTSVHTPVPPPTADNIQRVDAVQGFSVFQDPKSMAIYIVTCSRYAFNYRSVMRPLKREGLIFLVHGPIGPADLKAGKLASSGRTEILMPDSDTDAAGTRHLDSIQLGPVRESHPFCIMAKTALDTSHETWLYSSRQSNAEFRPIDLGSHPLGQFLATDSWFGMGGSVEVLQTQCGSRGTGDSPLHGIWVLRLVTFNGYRNFPPMGFTTGVPSQRGGLYLSFYQLAGDGSTQRQDYLHEPFAWPPNITGVLPIVLRDFTAGNDAVSHLRASRFTQFYDDSDKIRMLVVGGEKIGLVNTDSWETPATILGQGPTFRTTDLHLTQQMNEVRLWSKLYMKDRSGQYAPSLGWSSFNATASLSSVNEFQPFSSTTNDTIVRPCCTCMNPAHDQHIMTLDGPNIKVASQSRSTGAWAKAQSFFSFPKITEITPMQTYTTHISFRRNFKNNERKVEVSVKEGSHVIWLNGIRHAIVAGTAIQLSLRPVESLNIMQESSDLSAADFTVHDITSNESLPFSPSSMLTDKLANVTSQQLAAHGAQADGYTLEHAASQLQSLSARARQVPVIRVAGAGGPQITTLSIGSWVEEKWHWVEDQGHKVIHEFEADFSAVKVWIGDKLHTLALDTKQAVNRACAAILSGLKRGYEAVKSFLDGVFDVVKILQRTVDIETSMVSILDYGQAVIDDSIDGLVQTVRHHFNGVKQNADKLFDILEQFSGVNDAINEMNHPGALSGKLQQSAKLSILSTAPQKTKGIETPAPAKGKLLNSDKFKKAADKASAAMDAKPDLTKDLKKILSEIQDMFSAGVTFKGIIKFVKEIFHLIIDTADVLIESVLELIKVMIDHLVKSLKEPMEIPIITPLLRFWNWLTGGSYVTGLPSGTFMTSFMLAIVSVELEYAGIMPPPKQTPVFDVVHCWPHKDTGKQQAKAWFTKENSNPTTIIPNNNNNTIHTLSVAASSNDPNNNTSQPTADEMAAAEKYSLVNSYAHPIILGVHWLADIFHLVGAPVDAVFAYNNQPVIWKKITGAVRLALSLSELAFTFPAAAKRPGKTLLIIGWAFSCVTFGTGVITYGLDWGTIEKYEKALENLAIGCKILAFALTTAKNVLSSIALHEQMQSTTTTADAGEWDSSKHKDDEMLRLTVGNITCGFAIALAEITAEAGLYYTKKTQDPDGLIVFFSGEAVALVAAIPDIGVDARRSKLEHGDNYPHSGAYSSGCARR